MQRIFLIIILFSLYACTAKHKESGKPVIAVSILPQEYIVSSIADTLVEIVVMVPPGASPATWEATPGQMKSLSDALVYFRIGHIGFENAWMSKIGELNKEMIIVDLSEGIELIGIDYRHGDHSHTGTDPHTWMSPIRMEQMARTAYTTLIQLLPEYKEQFRRNYEVLMGEIKSVKGFVDRQLATSEGKTFLIFHPSLGYLANDHGLNQIAIEFEGKEPSPAHMKEVIDMARKEEIKVIFVQLEFDKRNAMVVTKEIGGKLIRINPLSKDWPSEMKSISTKLNNSFQ